ncbi:MAG: hypothetical protein VX642_03380 [Bdellovibrionota bacterium]|nr:hypothetical protein [Bdellovibrionota bacterium]
MSKVAIKSILIVLFSSCILFFQNCGSPIDFSSKNDGNSGLEVIPGDEENLGDEDGLDDVEECSENSVGEEDCSSEDDSSDDGSSDGDSGDDDDSSDDPADDEDEDDSTDLISCEENQLLRPHRNLLQNSSFEISDYREGLIHRIPLPKLRGDKYDHYSALPGRRKLSIDGKQRANAWLSKLEPMSLVSYGLSADYPKMRKDLRSKMLKRRMGSRHIELDSSGNSEMYQDFIVCNGEGQYELSFFYASHTGDSSSSMSVYIDDVLIDAINGDRVKNWFRMRYTLSNLNEGVHRIRFVAEGASDSQGALLDSVKLKMKRHARPGVVTILLSLGDQKQGQNVLDESLTKKLIHKVIRYSSAKHRPKILMIRDRNHRNETPQDTQYILSVLEDYRRGSDIVFMDEPDAGLSVDDLKDYDLIWWNNPGHPFSKKNSVQALLDFEGGVVISGDDMAHANGSSIQPLVEDLTGLKYLNNGVNFMGEYIDNNKGGAYELSINSFGLNRWLKKYDLDGVKAYYGNDIDHTEVTRDDLKVFVKAGLGHLGIDAEELPVVVGYKK